MAIDHDTRVTIVCLFRIEGWPVGTIARELGLHHSTVTRAPGCMGRVHSSGGSDPNRRTSGRNRAK